MGKPIALKDISIFRLSDKGEPIAPGHLIASAEVIFDIDPDEFMASTSILNDGVSYTLDWTIELSPYSYQQWLLWNNWLTLIEKEPIMAIYLYRLYRFTNAMLHYAQERYLMQKDRERDTPA